jgi:hypothetical protein
VFICDDCECGGLAFNETHTKMHTIVRLPWQVGKEISMEERLRLLEDELTKVRRILVEMGQTLGKVAEESAELLRGER